MVAPAVGTMPLGGLCVGPDIGLDGSFGGDALLCSGRSVVSNGTARALSYVAPPLPDGMRLIATVHGIEAYTHPLIESAPYVVARYAGHEATGSASDPSDTVVEAFEFPYCPAHSLGFRLLDANRSPDDPIGETQQIDVERLFGVGSSGEWIGEVDLFKSGGDSGQSSGVRGKLLVELQLQARDLAPMPSFVAPVLPPLVPPAAVVPPAVVPAPLLPPPPVAPAAMLPAPVMPMRPLVPGRQFSVQKVAKPGLVATKRTEYVSELKQKTTIQKEPGFQRQKKPDGQMVDVPGTWNIPKTTYERVVVPREKTVYEQRVTVEDQLVPMPGGIPPPGVLPLGSALPGFPRPVSPLPARGPLLF